MRVDEKQLYSRISARLKERREENKWTQQRLADETGVLRTTIANIESGRQQIPLHLLYGICAALGLKVTEVLPAVADVVQPDTVEVPVDGEVKRVPPKAAVLLNEMLKD